MAYTIENSNYAVFKIPIEREHLGDTETAVRNISIPDINTPGISGAQTILGNFRTQLAAIENYEYLFQPTSWRDEDSVEDAWTLKGGTSAITLEITSTTKSTFD